jgi:hypothetical protein
MERNEKPGRKQKQKIENDVEGRSQPSPSKPHHHTIRIDPTVTGMDTVLEIFPNFSGRNRSANNTTFDFLKAVLSSVTSPTLLDVVIIFQDFNFGGMGCLLCKPEPVCFRHLSQKEWDMTVRYYRRQLRKFRNVCYTRNFRLGFCADVSDYMVEWAVGILEHIVEVAKRRGELDYLPSEPLIISERRMVRTRYWDCHAGRSAVWYVPTSAL